VELSHSIAPSHAPAAKSTERAGVLCSDDLLAHVERAGPFAVELGEPLCSALVRSVEGSYRAAQRATKPPYVGQYPRVVRFDLQSSTLAIERRPDGAIRVTCALSVVVERFGRDLKRVSTQAVTGNSRVERSDAPDVLVREAVETAIQRVSDDASSLLVAGLDGPRQYAPAPEP
jgi:hypothetical protein